MLTRWLVPNEHNNQWTTSCNISCGCHNWTHREPEACPKSHILEVVKARFKIFYFNFVLSVLLICMSLYYTCAVSMVARKLELQMVRSCLMGAGNPGPLEEQPAISTTESSLQTLKSYFNLTSQSILLISIFWSLYNHSSRQKNALIFIENPNHLTHMQHHQSSDTV